ncbi:hypothetical protein [Photobacterium profundum]|uniref:hypothetical protein n=1 Tax=Photobacterium profundum TaxID=74109 RepID=UPI003D0FB312
MTIKTAGTISIQDIVNEFGGNVPHSLTEYYRGAGRVPDIPQNNKIPTSGDISITDFYGSVNEMVITVTTGGLKDSFGSFWTANIPKRAVINKGVTRRLLEIGTGLRGSLTVDNHGEIQGASGAPGKAGGDAVVANANVTINNYGAIRGGGGGGGSTTSREPSSGEEYTASYASSSYRTGIYTKQFTQNKRYQIEVWWKGSRLFYKTNSTSYSGPFSSSSSWYKSGWTYHKGTSHLVNVKPHTLNNAIWRSKVVVGGRGQGYGTSKATNGGTWGHAGGNSGGRGGYAINKHGHTVSVNNHGTINGSVV